jgi:hypothetical protein
MRVRNQTTKNLFLRSQGLRDAMKKAQRVVSDNPFETRKNRTRFEVMGRKVKGTVVKSNKVRWLVEAWNHVCALTMWGERCCAIGQAGGTQEARADYWG